MCNVMVSYLKRNEKVQRNERQSRSERSDSSRSEQADLITSGAIRVENIRDGAIRSKQTELRGIIILEQIGVKASGEKIRQIRAEKEHHGDIEEPFQNRKKT